MSAPARAKRRTEAAPMPREPPVMSAALPAREIMNPSGRTKIEKRKSNNGLWARSALHCGLAGRDHELAEQCGGECVAFHALGVPLDADDPVRVAMPLDRFNDAVGSVCGDAQATAGRADGLMMRTVDARLEDTGKRGEARIGIHAQRMVRMHSVLVLVLQVWAGLGGDVLNESPVEMDVQALDAVANGQHRFTGGESVIEHCAVCGFAMRIGRVRLGSASGPVESGVH